MTNPNDPVTASEHAIASGLGGTIEDEWKHKGLTKREYFAAMAMQAIMGKEALSHPEHRHPKFVVCEAAVELADALIAKLNKER